MPDVFLLVEIILHFLVMCEIYQKVAVDASDLVDVDTEPFQERVEKRIAFVDEFIVIPLVLTEVRNNRIILSG